MRKLTTGNKKSFVLFALIVIAIIAVLSCFLSFSHSIIKEEYIIDSDNFLYDAYYKPIELEEPGKIIKKWDGKYYLKINGHEESKLGAQSVVYQPDTKTINVYGKLYNIDVDGKVTKNTKKTEISKTSEDKLYKLNDRKYMIVGDSIYNETGTLSTTRYLMILLDKAGNTYLLNHELNSKTIKPIIIKTATFDFDVANEKLIYQDKKFDLKRIIGSSNQYIEPKPKVKVAKEGSTTINNNNTTNNNTTNNTNNNQNNSNINVVQEKTKKVELVRSANLKGVTTTSSYIDVKYNIEDPENKYQTVALLIDGDGYDKLIALDKEKDSCILEGLIPNTEYKITMMTKELDSKGEQVENIVDIITTRTDSVQSELKITKRLLDSISFTLKMDRNQHIDKAEIVLYVDGVASARQNVNMDKATSKIGWSGSIPYNYGSEIELRIENAEYDGKQVVTDINTKIKNY